MVVFISIESTSTVESRGILNNTIIQSADQVTTLTCHKVDGKHDSKVANKRLFVYSCDLSYRTANSIMKNGNT